MCRLLVLCDFQPNCTSLVLHSQLLKLSSLKLIIKRHIFTGHLPSDIYDVACHTDDQSLNRGSCTALLFNRVSTSSLCSLNLLKLCKTVCFYKKLHRTLSEAVPVWGEKSCDPLLLNSTWMKCVCRTTAAHSAWSCLANWVKHNFIFNRESAAVHLIKYK